MGMAKSRGSCLSSVSSPLFLFFLFLFPPPRLLPLNYEPVSKVRSWVDIYIPRTDDCRLPFPCLKGSIATLEGAAK